MVDFRYVRCTVVNGGNGVALMVWSGWGGLGESGRGGYTALGNPHVGLHDGCSESSLWGVALNGEGECFVPRSRESGGCLMGRSLRLGRTPLWVRLSYYFRLGNVIFAFSLVRVVKKGYGK